MVPQPQACGHQEGLFAAKDARLFIAERSSAGSGSAARIFYFFVTERKERSL
jgi:hypothetical protein